MKRVLAAAARAAMVTAALAFAACSSSSGTIGSGTVDTATAPSDAAGDTGGAKADGTTADTAGGTADGGGTELPKPDVGADVAKDIAAPKPEYGTCTGTADQACLQGCAQSGCMTEIQGCLGDPVCDKLYKCVGGCQAATPVMPPQDGTPVAQLPNEATPAYCTRVCFLQGGNLAAGKLTNFNTCIIGKCLDCDKINPQLSTLCKAQCGAYAKCGDEIEACNKSEDCLKLSGCIAQCNDQPCAEACAKGASAAGADLYTKLAQCTNANKDMCVAPK